MNECQSQQPLSTLRNQHSPIDKVLRQGLTFHFGDTLEQQDRVSHGQVDDHMRIVLLLEGSLDLRFGDHALHMKSASGRSIRNQGSYMDAALIALNAPERFSRISHKGHYSRRISLGLSAQWVDDALHSGGLNSSGCMSGFRRHLNTFRWRATPHACSIAEQMLAPPALSEAIAGVYLESRALELIIEAWSTLTDAQPCTTTPRLSVHATRRIHEVAAWLQEHASRHLTLADIAREAHMSTATLQRHFKQVHGITVADYLLRTRMQQSHQALTRQGLSVTEAAHLAGYSSPSNFATAFRRYFGISPRQVRT